MSSDPHLGGPVRHSGAKLEEAAGVVVLLHGRGGSAEDILSLVPELYLSKLAYLAPQAEGNSWYPYSFLAPVSQNQPWLTSALHKVAEVVGIANEAGIPTERIVIGGFSQGACLATEFVASHPQRYAGLIAFTGGLIGPPEADLSHPGDLLGTPAFFGSGDPDPHVPWLRVEQSARAVSAMGGTVTTRRYPGRGHSIGSDELALAKKLIDEAFAQA
jgi:phospholipase/carboxylesterase